MKQANKQTKVVNLKIKTRIELLKFLFFNKKGKMNKNSTWKVE